MVVLGYPFTLNIGQVKVTFDQQTVLISSLSQTHNEMDVMSR